MHHQGNSNNINKYLSRLLKLILKNTLLKKDLSTTVKNNIQRQLLIVIEGHIVESVNFQRRVRRHCLRRQLSKTVPTRLKLAFKNSLT